MLFNVCIFNILPLHVIGNLRMAKPMYEELEQRVKILEEELGFKVLKTEEPQSVAALGAAIIAREKAEKGTDQ